MASIIASNIPPTVTKDKVAEFFSFCGKIDKLVLISGKEDKLQKYQVVFASEKALQTALLLNEAELGGSVIKVETTTTKDSLPAYQEVVSKEEEKTTTEKLHTGDSEYDDVAQEEKPKYAIMAQLLASGYVVSDNVIEKAIAVDQEKGISKKFTSFLENLDNKYIHSKDPNSTANKHKQLTETKFTELRDGFHKSSFKQTLDNYYEAAVGSKYGIKVHEFYKSLAKDAHAVHVEAKRLAEVKKHELAAEKATTNATTTETPETVATKLETTTLSEKK